MKDLAAFRLYTRVARLGSFSAAAREAGLAQSQVSRMIADLEASLGVRLLMRTTRAVTPTEPGQEFLARMEPILAAIEDAENSVRETGELRGSLRIGMPSTMAARVVIPRLSRFVEQHPRLHVDLLLDDRRQDMVREAIDVGIRVGDLPDSAGTSRRIGTMHRIIVASQAYLDSRGWPQRPEDLSRHRIIGGPVGSRPSSWRLARDGETVAIALEPHVSANDTMGAIAAAVAGLGITATTSWACRQELADRSLIRLLADWSTPELAVHAYFPSGRATRLAARAFVDFLVDDFGLNSPAIEGAPSDRASRTDGRAR